MKNFQDLLKFKEELKHTNKYDKKIIEFYNKYNIKYAIPVCQMEKVYLNNEEELVEKFGGASMIYSTVAVAKSKVGEISIGVFGWWEDGHYSFTYNTLDAYIDGYMGISYWEKNECLHIGTPFHHSSLKLRKFFENSNFQKIESGKTDSEKICVVKEYIYSLISNIEEHEEEKIQKIENQFQEILH